LRLDLLTASIVTTNATNIQIRLLSEDIQQLEETNKIKKTKQKQNGKQGL